MAFQLPGKLVFMEQSLAVCACPISVHTLYMSYTSADNFVVVHAVIACKSAVLLLKLALQRFQVFQLPYQKPDKVLKRIWENLDRAIKQGDEKALHIQNNLRVVAAGGDGTYSWLLQAIGYVFCSLCSFHCMRAVTGSVMKRTFNDAISIATQSRV